MEWKVEDVKALVIPDRGRWQPWINDKGDVVWLHIHTARYCSHIHTHTHRPTHARFKVMHLSYIHSIYSLSWFRMENFSLWGLLLSTHFTRFLPPSLPILLTTSLPLSTHIYHSLTIVHGIMAQREKPLLLVRSASCHLQHLCNCLHDCV